VWHSTCRQHIAKHTNEYAEEKRGRLMGRRNWRSVCRVWLGVILPRRSPDGSVGGRGPCRPIGRWGLGRASFTRPLFPQGLSFAPRAAFVPLCPSIWAVLDPGCGTGLRGPLHSQTTPPVFVRSTRFFNWNEAQYILALACPGIAR
jgi:hypothetical protein